jgi:hypothetical protein
MVRGYSARRETIQQIADNEARELLERRNSRVYAFPVSSEIADPFQVAGIEEISKSVICG